MSSLPVTLAMAWAPHTWSQAGIFVAAPNDKGFKHEDVLQPLQATSHRSKGPLLFGM